MVMAAFAVFGLFNANAQEVTFGVKAGLTLPISVEMMPIILMEGQLFTLEV